MNSTKISSKKSNIALSLSIIDSSINLNILQQNSLQEYLNKVPGVFTLNANNFAQDLRISIRGFGARSAFGIRGIKLVVDGIPETTPDGQGQLDNLNLGIIKKIEVIRGPSASLYGNASGGVINIESLSDFKNDFVNLKTTIGSYGMENYQASLGLKKSNLESLFHINRIKNNGYRDRSRIEQSNFLSKVSYKSKKNGAFKALLSYTDSPYAGDSGGLTNEERNQKRTQARSANKEYDTYESIDHFKTSLQWNLERSSNFKWAASTFYSKRNFYGKLPFEFGGIINLNRYYWGGNLNIEIKRLKEKSVNTFLLGSEWAVQNDLRKRFKNIKGLQGEITLNQLESFKSISFYLIDHLKFKEILFTFGLRWDQNILGTDQNEININLNKLNPSFGFNYTISNNKNIWSSFSSSFETPTLSELSSNPYNQIGLNPSLSTQKASNVEIGYRSKSEKHEFEIVGFYIPTDDEIVPYEIEEFPGRTFYRNAGKTIRKGLEVVLNYKFSNNINLDNTYTFSEFKFNNYILNSKNLKGNVLPGIPKNLFNSTLNIKAFKGLIISSEMIFNGDIYTSDDNNIKEKSFWLGNFKIGKKWETNNFSWNPYFALNNAFNTYYSDNIRINAFGARHYEPAPLRSFYLGLNLKVNN